MSDSPLTPAQVTEVMRQRGYELSWHSGNHKTYGFVKQFDAPGGRLKLCIGIAADVHLDTHEIQLHSGIGLLRITTGMLSFMHPKFETLFELPLMRAAEAVAKQQYPSMVVRRDRVIGDEDDEL